MEIAYFLLSVLFVSLSGVLMPGPVFAVVVRHAPQNRWAGLQVAVAHAAIELPIFVGLALGFSQLIASPVVRLVVAVVGGAALVVMGIDALRAKVEASAAVAHAASRPSSMWRGFRSTFFVASLNPYFFLWWATAGVAIVTKAMQWSFHVVAAVYAMHILTDIVWYGSVGFLTNRAIPVGSRWQRWLIRFCGLAMAGFGIYFLATAVGLYRVFR